jgi:cell division septation protein DedD
MAERSAPTHPDGDREFELVLGNKQLFSLLFIMFVLLGVFFAMGYTLGRTSAPPETATASGGAQPQTASRPAPRPSVVDGAVPEQKQEAPTAKQEQPAAEQPAGGSGTLTIIDPKPGQIFCQVTAVARPEAELLVEVLQKKGFRAAMAPGPDKFVRVLVGPAANDAELVKLKTDLEQAGFKPFVRRY